MPIKKQAEQFPKKAAINRALENLGASQYRLYYNKGWRASQTGQSMSTAEDKFILKFGEDLGGAFGAWQDGWLDYAVGREQFHTRDHDPNTCDDH